MKNVNAEKIIVGYDPETDRSIAPERIAATESVLREEITERKTKTDKLVFEIEDKQRRSANARHYIGENGERKAVFSGSPRHYYSEADKRMRRIDNTLELREHTDSDDFDGYENKYNAFKVRFAKDATAGDLMRVVKDGYEITFAVADGNGGKTRVRRCDCHAVLHERKCRAGENDDDNLESGIKYAELFDGVDFDYEVKSDKVKENIRINKRQENYEFAFKVCAKGLRMEMNVADNTVEFYPEDKHGDGIEPIFTMPAPFMTDNGGATSYDIRYSTEKIDEHKYLLKILPNVDWINADNRAFPVTIDPSVIILGISAVNYKFVSEGSGTSFYQEALGLKYIGYFIGNNLDAEAQKGVGETYLYIGLRKDAVTDGRIENAEMTLPIWKYNPKNDVFNANGFFSVYGVPENMEINWNNMNSLSSEILSNAKPIEKEGNYYLNFDITSSLRTGYKGFVIKGNHLGDVKNGGWWNKAFVPTDPSSVSFAITYTTSDRIYGNKSITQSCNDAGVGAIDLFTGNLSFVHDILNLEGTQFPMNISLLYNSKHHDTVTYGGYAFGLGWRPNFLQTVKQITAPVGKFSDVEGFKCYEYTDGNGYKQEISTRYYKNHTTSDGKTYKLYGEFVEETGMLSEIGNDNYELTESGNVITLKDQAGNKLIFTSGKLTSIEKSETVDNGSLKMTIEYGDNFITVTDANGRVVKFNFSSTKILQSVEYNNQTIRTFTYTASRITKMTLPSGDIMLTYDSANSNLKKITDPSGYTVEYKSDFDEKPKITGYYVKSSVREIAYNADEKAGKVTGSEKTLDEITITYNTGSSVQSILLGPSENLTCVKNLSGAETYYCFKPDGTLQAVFDDKGNLEVCNGTYKVNEMILSGSKVKSLEIKQFTAKVLADAETVSDNNTEYVGPMAVFSATDFDKQNAIHSRHILRNYANLSTGTYVFFAQVQGALASGRFYNTVEEYKENHTPYLIMKITKNLRNGSSQTESIRFMPATLGIGKNQTVFFPFFVDKSEVSDVSACVESWYNPNAVTVMYWKLLCAVEGSSVTIKDKDTVTFESYANGVYTTVTSDITKRSGNKRLVKTKRGSASEITASSTYGSQYPERVTSETDGLTYDKVYTYDSVGNVSEEKITDKSTGAKMLKKYGYASENAKLNNNALTSVTDEDGNECKYDYYPETGFIKRTMLPGTNQNIDYTYNGIEGLLKSIKAQQNGFVEETENTLSYNCGYLTKLEHNGCEYKFKYDGFGRMTEISVGGEKYMQAAYTDNGNNIDGVEGAVNKTVVAYCDSAEFPAPYCGREYCGEAVAKASGNQVYASYYDKHGELLKVRYVTGTDVNYAFDESCDYVTIKRISEYNRSAIEYTVGNTVYEYELDKTTGEVLNITEYEYGNIKQTYESLGKDSYGRASGAKYSTVIGTQTYTYGYKSNYEDVIRIVNLPSGVQTITETDGFGRITSHKFGAGFPWSETYTYKANKSDGNYTTPLVSSMSSVVGGNYFKYNYTYDNNGNITQIHNNADALLARYEYDGLNRLIREDIPNGKIILYFYDKSGNITSKKIFDYTDDNAGMSTETLRNSVNGTTIPYTYMTSGNKDRLLTYNGSGALTYDGFGNPKQWFKHGTEGSELKYALNWSHVNRLTEITDKDTGEKYEYTYNHNGIRTSKKVGNAEHKYYLDGSNIIAETRTTGDRVDKLEYYYDTTGIVGFRYNGNDYYYTKNIQGDIERIYNSTGSTYAVYEYDAWGNRKITYDPNGIAEINPFGYRGYYLDNETKLWYLNSRYYDSAVGRFLSPDRLDYLDPAAIGGLNLYAYCNNNPVMYYDPSGTWTIAAILTTLFTIIGSFLIGYMVIDLLYKYERDTHVFGNLINSIADWFDAIFNFDVSFDNTKISNGSIYYAKKETYKPKHRGVRVRGRSKKDAEEKARKRGGGKKPIHHGWKFKDGKWLPPHYHPNVPEGHPFFHDHYYYPLILLLGILNDINEEYN